MSEQHAFRGRSDADKVAILLELLMTTATPADPTPFSASINTALDSLTEAQVASLMAGFDARLKRGTYGA